MAECLQSWSCGAKPGQARLPMQSARSRSTWHRPRFPQTKQRHRGPRPGPAQPDPTRRRHDGPGLGPSAASESAGSSGPRPGPLRAPAAPSAAPSHPRPSPARRDPAGPTDRARSLHGDRAVPAATSKRKWLCSRGRSPALRRRKSRPGIGAQLLVYSPVSQHTPRFYWLGRSARGELQLPGCKAPLSALRDRRRARAARREL